VKILVVDDEPSVRNLTVEILRRSGYEPHGVPTARQALDLLDEQRFDLIVSDVMMPEMTGVELLYELRRRQPDVRVILMTGGSEEPERTAKAVELGAVGLLYKPFSHAELKEAVRQVGGRVPLEASGGMTLDRLPRVAAAGVDYVSVGALTHSAPAVDLSLLVEGA